MHLQSQRFVDDGGWSTGRSKYERGSHQACRTPSAATAWRAGSQHFKFEHATDLEAVPVILARRYGKPRFLLKVRLFFNAQASFPAQNAIASNEHRRGNRWC